MVKSVLVKLIICIILSIILANSFCAPSAYALGDTFLQGKEFLEAGDSIDSKINTTVLQETSDTIYNTLLAIAIMIAIVVAMVLGIQFIAASADEKAKVKEALMPFVVGCVVVFGSFTIWKVAVNMGNRAEDSIISASGGFADPSVQDLIDKVINGKVSIQSLSDSNLKELYTACSIGVIRYDMLRKNNWNEAAMEKEFLENEKNYTAPLVEIFKECKARNLLDDEWLYIKK